MPQIIIARENRLRSFSTESAERGRPAQLLFPEQDSEYARSAGSFVSLGGSSARRLSYAPDYANYFGNYTVDKAPMTR